MSRSAILATVLLLALPAAGLAQGVESAPASTTVPVQASDPAQSRAAQLDRLFARLYKAASAEEAAGIEKKIWASWNSNISPTAELLLHQSGVAMADGANDTAEDMLNTLVEAYPDFTEALNRRATLYYNLKRYPESLKDIERVLEAEPRHFGALMGKGMILQEQGKYSAAKSAFQDALAINPKSQSAEDAVKVLRRLAPDL